MNQAPLVGGTPLNVLQAESQPPQLNTQKLQPPPPPQLQQQPTQQQAALHQLQQQNGVSHTSQNSMLQQLKKNITIDDIYLPLFVSVVYYIGQKKIISRPISERFGSGFSVYISIALIFVISYMFNKYFLVR
tara:strand:+ start:2668 stop:3063 length:396 start_codon:yes stop_codon:yes gene_type:complete